MATLGATPKSPSKRRARKETPQAGGIDEYLAATPMANGSGETMEEQSAAEVVAAPEPSTSAVSGAGEEPKSVASRPTATVKRPRQRAVAMPDLSFFPPVVAEICERVARHKSRSAILDEADYDAFVAQYDGLRRDWETLDKVRRGRIWSVLLSHPLTNGPYCHAFMSRRSRSSSSGARACTSSWSSRRRWSSASRSTTG
jgi:hypothetical protein